MRLGTKIAVLAAALGMAASPTWAGPKTKRLVAVPLMAQPVSPDEMRERTVAASEVFFVQHLSALKSVTLRADVRVAALLGSIGYAKGTRLVFAQEKDGKGEFYCGVFHAPALPGAPNGGRQWVCFEDADNDGFFDLAYTAPLNKGAFLPTFDYVLFPRSVHAPYTRDADDQTFFYEVGFAHGKPYRLNGMIPFVEMMREAGDSAWSGAGSNIMGVLGDTATISSKELPQNIRLDHALFSVTAADGVRGGLSGRLPGMVGSKLMLPTRSQVPTKSLA